MPFRAEVGLMPLTRHVDDACMTSMETTSTYTEPAADDHAAILAQQTRSDVVSRDPIGCRCRWHAGRCVVETLSDGSTRHVETFSDSDARIWNHGQTRNVHVMTQQGFRH